MAIRIPTSIPAAIMTGLLSKTMVQWDGSLATSLPSSRCVPGTGREIQSNMARSAGRSAERTVETAPVTSSFTSLARICSSIKTGKMAPASAE